jgi:exosortase A-associated hydrolase 1
VPDLDRCHAELLAGIVSEAREFPVVFECEGEQLLGVVSAPPEPASTGVLIVVGGPQYRVGSHRQFVFLARALARNGYAALRFDYRGMGDSGGAKRSFEAVDEDIVRAAEALRAAVPKVRKLVVFGLCDAASAALIAAARLPDLAGLMLANPWVRREATANATIVRHYYVERLRSAEFWRGVLTGRGRLLGAIAEFVTRLVRAQFGTCASKAAHRNDFVARMIAGWQSSRADRLLLLSGRDLTAREFEDVFRRDSAWRRTLPGTRCQIVRIDDADHTFSVTEHRLAVEQACVRFLAQL